MRDVVRIVVLSDTHRFHARIAVPDGDVLVHAGDFCLEGTEKEAQAFARHWRELPHRHKVVVAGNHDRCLESDPALAPILFQGSRYLLDAGAEVAGLRFYGSPWQPEFLDWAFNLPRGRPLRERWDRIPEGLDVLVTHGPPYGIRDRMSSGERVGCEDLAAALERARPRLHVFGHIHEGYGAERRNGTLYVNASSCDAEYRPSNAPIVIDVPLDATRPAELAGAL